MANEKSNPAFVRFQKANKGAFDGFEFVDEFHAVYDKRNAVEVLTSDDKADCITSAGVPIYVGADGVTVYIMTTNARDIGTRKLVRFNQSVYVF